MKDENPVIGLLSVILLLSLGNVILQIDTLKKLGEQPNVQEIKELNNQLDSLGAEVLSFDEAISADEYVIFVSDGKEWIPLYYVQKSGKAVRSRD